jgi:hypothetical protein
MSEKSTTITTSAELRASIHAYQVEIALPGLHGDKIRKLISQTKKWVATREKPCDPWILAPAKFAGYVGLDAKSYCEGYTKMLKGKHVLDGRRAVYAIRAIHDPRPLDIHSGEPYFDELLATLTCFCSNHDRRPYSDPGFLGWCHDIAARENEMREERVTLWIGGKLAYDPDATDPCNPTPADALRHLLVKRFWDKARAERRARKK